MRASYPAPVDRRSSQGEAFAAPRVVEPLYARIMGDSWFQLAQSIRQFHSTRSTAHVHGWMRVERGDHRLARVLARNLRLPHSAAAGPAELKVTVLDDGELWERTINGRRLETWQYDANASELVDRYGCLEFRFRLRASGGRLLFIQREAAVRIGAVRLPLPGYLAPRVEAHEDDDGEGRIRMSVSVTLPGIGLLIAYQGIIDIAETRA